MSDDGIGVPAMMIHCCRKSGQEQATVLAVCQEYVPVCREVDDKDLNYCIFTYDRYILNQAMFLIGHVV